MRKRFLITVAIEMHEATTIANAERAVHSWLETNGYKSTGHGFDFIETVGAIVDQR
jgi:hypothetical protein